MSIWSLRTMDDVRKKYDSLIRTRNTHELSMLRDEIDMALIRIEKEEYENRVKMSGDEGKRTWRRSCSWKVIVCTEVLKF